MDDYFYPYRIAGIEFPDDSSFSKFGSGYQYEMRDDWRRENVNKIIKQISDTIKSRKPWVEFGISPFGVWRNLEKDPTGSNTRAGQTNYDDLFADILLWQRNGWIDYITPQIYWHIGFNLADYSVLADWWAQNAYGCNLYIGQAPYRIDKKSTTRDWRSSKEIIRQIRLNRSMPEISGTMFFSARVLKNNPLRLHERLVRDYYKYPSLTPENKRIVQQVASAPSEAVLRYGNGMIEFSWSLSENAKNYVIYRFRKGKPADISDPSNIIHVTSGTEFLLPVGKRSARDNYTYYITSRSRTNAESEPMRFRISD
jgi:uncharacterized lipoprotein YddW (UPF0748 family)